MNPPISQLADTFKMQIFILGFNQMLSKCFFSQRFFSQLNKKNLSTFRRGVENCGLIYDSAQSKNCSNIND